MDLKYSHKSLKCNTHMCFKSVVINLFLYDDILILIQKNIESLRTINGILKK